MRSSLCFTCILIIDGVSNDLDVTIRINEEIWKDRRHTMHCVMLCVHLLDKHLIKWIELETLHYVIYINLVTPNFKLDYY